jgi:K+-transporting ATPase ATPase C chain
MFTVNFAQMKIALRLLLVLTVLTGLLYPAIVTGIAQWLFSEQANGSLITQNDKVIGSSLIGQSFSDAAYFWSRPSATAPFSYNAENSSGSNLGPTNPDFIQSVKERANRIQQSDPSLTQAIPVDLVTASASGLDPDISPLAAQYQVHRVASARGVAEQEVQALILQAIQPRDLGLLGEPRVNVLQLNLALDRLKPHAVKV